MRASLRASLRALRASLTMPDKRKHRGAHPDDQRLFAPEWHERLRTAVSEYSWLLSRGYAPDSSLKLVGDRYDLEARQRTAVMRSACSDEALAQRRRTCIPLAACRGGRIAIDGYNLLIALESALSGGLLLIGRDGACRDLASLHGSYRKVQETVPALELIIDHLTAAGVAAVDFYLDRPVSNSGRLKVVLAGLLERRGCVLGGAAGAAEEGGGPSAAGGAQGGASDKADGRPSCWNIELVDNPDPILAKATAPIVSSDSWILDRCDRWINLAAEMGEEYVAGAWRVDLR